MMDREKLNILRNGVVSIVREIINPLSLSDSLEIERKSDKSIVTRVDKEVSSFIENETKFLTDAGYHFFSEENPASFGFPSIILDPIDGTRELAHGLGECVVSLAVMQGPESGFAWIYNPFTGLELSSLNVYVPAVTHNSENLFGYVSRSDTAKGMYKDLSLCEGVSIAARGSIAFKLSLLAGGACDFVYSRTPKNIWDIAAGTLLCWQRGFKLYQNERELKSLDQIRIDGELMWCREEVFVKLSDSLMNNSLK